MGTQLWRKVIPSGLRAWLKRRLHARQRARISRLPKLSEQEFAALLREQLQLARGDMVFVHSSMDSLSISFSPFRMLGLLLEAVADEGTLIFPTYPDKPSAQVLMEDQLFDQRKTPSYMGMLTELARRHPKAVRSLHPTKSVCAIGARAAEVTAQHHLSPYPFGALSPYRKAMQDGGKIVGLGITTTKLAFAHCVEDELRDAFPLPVYHPKLFKGRCLDRNGAPVIVETYAHDIARMNHAIPTYMRRYVDPGICLDFEFGGMPFFRARAALLFERMVALAMQKITIYTRA